MNEHLSTALHPPEAPDPNLRQQEASHPESITWVSASAGSGKTKVLTDRVLRLMLPDPEGRWDGTPPHRLLCITFTKAGAAEMRLRMQKRLSAWAVMPEADLSNDLHRLCGVQPNSSFLLAARRLFADVLDCPGGLRILTIHAFCQSVLGRFPLEAGVSPDFKVLEEAQAGQLFSSCIDRVLLSAQGAGNGDMAEAFRTLSPFVGLEELRTEIRAVLKHPNDMKAATGGATTLSAIQNKFRTGLRMPSAMTSEELKSSVSSHIDEPALRTAVSTLCSSNLKAPQSMGRGLQLWLDLNPAGRADALDTLLAALLTDKNTLRKPGASFEDAHPETMRSLQDLYTSLISLIDDLARLEQTSLTASLFFLAQNILATYEDDKKRIGALDFDDLIRRTDKLLSESGSAWVHYKLDGGIDHILMDEAQDTNTSQWSIIERLRQEIFSGSGRETRMPRSFFVVGDEKQSIFSFQGADPAGFSAMKTRVQADSEAIGRNFRDVKLDVSFRTSPPVLALVDHVFTQPALRQRLGLPPQQTLRHYSYRSREAGLVELWPLLPKNKKSKRADWTLPLDESAAGEQTESLATRIAQQISFWFQSRERLESENRPLQPGDILVLVRTRNAFVHDLVRQLKRHRIPVTGVDRMILTDQIGVQDCLSLARFARLPSDDFSLACVLKSPLVGWADDELMEVAIGRPGSLWENLQRQASPVVKEWLKNLIELSAAAPFEFLETALNQPCPADPEGTGWRAMTMRLGEDILDPLGELLSLCLQLEAQGIRTLDDLIVWQQKTRTEIKREMDENRGESQGQVRIMTVHAAKGLEAPVVILPDTVSGPTRGRINKLIWPDEEGLAVPLWAPSQGAGCAAYKSAGDRVYDDLESEQARLLYVALTRARDRLYVMGVETSDPAYERSWYKMIKDAFGTLTGVKTLDNGRLQINSAQTFPVRTLDRPTSVRSLPAPPAWLHKKAPVEPDLPRILTPSRADEASLPSYSPFDPTHPYRVQRGILSHTLFQFLPDINDSARDQAARFYLERAGSDLPAEMREEIRYETLRILRDPVFAPVFAPNSLAEVPITGMMADGRRINGQIDRLVIDEGTILIVDYKTNRPSPRNAENIPGIYREQLRSYHDALALIYPKSLIKCAILWTDQPLLMPVPI